MVDKEASHGLLLKLYRRPGSERVSTFINVKLLLAYRRDSKVMVNRTEDLLK